MKIQRVILGTVLILLSINLLIFLSSKLKDDYEIKIQGIRRDIRTAPHWDLIRIVWTNDKWKLVMRTGYRTEETEHYNWLLDRFE